MPVRAVLFDFDGTLADSFSAITSSTNHVREKYGLPPLTEAQVRESVGWGLAHLMATLIPHVSTEETVATYREHHPQVMLSGTRLCPGVAETLPELQRREHLAALVDGGRLVPVTVEGVRGVRYVLGEEMAQRAEAAGMDVHRVFFPHATWDAVLAAIQGASFVAYYGHGYGWPSNTPELWEVQQNGMGLNAYDGSGAYEVDYYGANKIRQSIRLAPHAVVFLMRGCYTAGNGLNEDPIPPLDIARQHVDNYASGWLAVGAGAVFAFANGSRYNYPEQLMTGDATTVDELFSTAGDAIGANPLYFASQRTPGARNHLDPHPTKGYLRAISGDLEMSAAMWRSGAGAIIAV